MFRIYTKQKNRNKINIAHINKDLSIRINYVGKNNKEKIFSSMMKSGFEKNEIKHVWTA